MSKSNTQQQPLTLQEQVDKYIQLDNTLKGIEKEKKALKEQIDAKLGFDDEVANSAGTQKVCKTARETLRADENLIKVLEEEGVYEKAIKVTLDTPKVRAFMETNDRIHDAVNFDTGSVISVKKVK